MKKLFVMAVLLMGLGLVCTAPAHATCNTETWNLSTAQLNADASYTFPSLPSGCGRFIVTYLGLDMLDTQESCSAGVQFLSGANIAYQGYLAVNPTYKPTDHEQAAIPAILLPFPTGFTIYTGITVGGGATIKFSNSCTNSYESINLVYTALL
jgi:hypothetical protein